MGFWVTEIHQNPLNDTPKVIKLLNRSENRPCPFPAADLIFSCEVPDVHLEVISLFLRERHGQGEGGGDADGRGCWLFHWHEQAS